MPSPLLVLTFCAFLPASSEVDMAPVLAPAILVEEGSLSGDCTQAVDLTEVADAGTPTKSSGDRDATVAPDLGPALVVDSNN